MLIDYWYDLLDMVSIYRARFIAGFVALVAAFVAYQQFRPEPVHVALECILIDLSRSTLSAQKDYELQTRSLLQSQAERDGDVCLLPITGDPARDGQIQDLPLGKGEGDNSREASSARIANQRRAAARINAVLNNPPPVVGGSAIVEALNMTAREVKPGDSIHIYSDGLQESERFTLRDLKRGQPDISQGAIDAALDDLEDDGLIPDLSGVKVTFDTPSYRPGEKSSVVTDEQSHRFWTSWADRAQIDGDLGWGAPGG